MESFAKNPQLSTQEFGYITTNNLTLTYFFNKVLF